MSWTVIWILCAVWAFLSRWIGDFLIQRSTRKVGDRETLLVVALSATIFLFPFIYHDLNSIFLFKNIFILLLAAGIFLIMSLLSFESLKRGKISVVEPIFTLEVPVAVFLAFIFFNETIFWQQWILITILLIWLILVSLKPHHFRKYSWLEAWVLLAILAAIFEWISNFVVSFSSRINNPLLTIRFLSFLSAVVSFVFLMRKHSIKTLRYEIVSYKKLFSWLGILDNLWWIFFAFSVTLIPIAIATSLSESYIALASLLGLLINKEKLFTYQKIWFIITFFAAIALAFVS